jgi:hypothetical protein
MNRKPLFVSLLLLAAALTALPATAEIFVVTLTNGSSLETGRQPEQASWDASTVLVLTEVGNWIGIPKSQVKLVATRDAIRGFGRRIDSTTVALGESPNDQPEPGAKTDPAARYDNLLQRIADQRDADRNYSVSQGVSTDRAQGIPLNALGFGSFPVEPNPERMIENQDRISNPNQ